VRFRTLLLLIAATALPLTFISTMVGSSAASAGTKSAAGTKTKKTSFTLSCVTGIASGDVKVTTTQTYPSSVAAGATFTIEWSSVTEVEGALASAAYATAPDGSEQGTVTTDNDQSTDGSPSTLNVAGSGIPEEGSISSPNGFPIYTPPQGSSPGYFTTQSFTAGTKGKDKISAGDDDANVTIYNSSGGTVTNTTADCTPVGTPKVIATIKVT
jgi:hypothetical protein